VWTSTLHDNAPTCSTQIYLGGEDSNHGRCHGMYMDGDSVRITYGKITYSYRAYVGFKNNVQAVIYVTYVGLLSNDGTCYF